MHADHEPFGDHGVSGGGHARWVGEQLAHGRLLELGNREQAERTWRVRGVWRRRLLHGACAVAAVGCAGAGAALLIARTTVTVSISASTYRIGDAVLHATSPDIYTGDGALVISADGQGVRAAASAVVGGRAWEGVCEVNGSGGRETCEFWSGTSRVGTIDVWSGGGWERRYSDGQRVMIGAPHGAPVPFPVGR